MEKTDWYKDAVIYQLHVRSFYDSNADGIGDFCGLIQKLDYIKFLGANTIWILPFYPSPLKDEGYDIADYKAVNPIYGTLADFKKLLNEAHKRDIRVITELVINHTSDQHEWFKKSREAKKNSHWRQYYIWSDSTEKFQDARIIFKDFESSNWSWDPVAKAYYFHRFYTHQPDLNYDNPQVQKEILKIVDFWLGLGVDGLRLDAIPYLFKREGTNCENLPETHQFLKKLRQHVDAHYPNRMLLAEANQWPEEAAAYFGDGDECHMAFHFPIMPRMYMAIQMGNCSPLLEILQQTPRIPSNCQWATFLRNHDELTLEMVTDEERDYMYRMYAHDPQMRINLGIRRRLAPLLGGDKRKIQLLVELMLSLPGTPVIYYGDEIGMGDNIYLSDRDGVRTPMQWNNSMNAGFSAATPQQLYPPVIIDPLYHYQSINVELQQHDLHSLLWKIKHCIEMRKKHSAFSRGEIHYLQTNNPRVLAYIRSYDDENILVVVNLSQAIQCVELELDLSSFKGKKVVELFNKNHFPTIKTSPYFLSLNAYSCFWLSIGEPTAEQTLDSLKTIPIKKNWLELFYDKSLPLLQLALINYFYQVRWFKAKSKIIKHVSIYEQFIPLKEPLVTGLIFTVDYFHDDIEYYFLPITCIAKEKVIDNDLVIAEIEEKGKVRVLIDATYDRSIMVKFAKSILKSHSFAGLIGNVSIQKEKSYNLGDTLSHLHDDSVKLIEHSNTLLQFSDIAMLKIYRKLDFGKHPEVQVTKHIQDMTEIDCISKTIATFMYQDKKNEITLGIIQQYIQHESNAWDYTLNTIKTLASESSDIHDSIIFSNYLKMVAELATCTAKLHNTLGSSHSAASFVSENYTLLDQRSLYQKITNYCSRLLASSDQLTVIKNCENKIYEYIKNILTRPLKGRKIQCHNDYHLGQILLNQSTLYITDFEGEPQLPLSERQIKRSPLRDVASMLRSFHYAICFANKDYAEINFLLEWYNTVSCQFLKTYFSHINPELIPKNTSDRMMLLQIYLIEKALYEIHYELNNRPDYVDIPCQGLLHILSSQIVMDECDASTI